MLTTIDIKDARIEFKTSKELKSLLQGAANSLGMDLSSFLISTATQRAKDIMPENFVGFYTLDTFSISKEIFEHSGKPNG